MPNIFADTDDRIALAREWLLDIADAGIFADDPDELAARFASMRPESVRRAVERHFEGGWRGFLDCVEPVQDVQAQMDRASWTMSAQPQRTGTP